MKVNINDLDELFQAMGKYQIPTPVILDVNNRVRDWLSSGGNETDNYILNQCKYVENIINKTMGEC